MTIHIPSLILGSILTYALSAVLLILMCVAARRRKRKLQDKALDQVLVGVAVKCMEAPAYGVAIKRPIDERVN